MTCDIFKDARNCQIYLGTVEEIEHFPDKIRVSMHFCSHLWNVETIITLASYGWKMLYLAPPIYISLREPCCLHRVQKTPDVNVTRDDSSSLEKFLHSKGILTNLPQLSSAGKATISPDEILLSALGYSPSITN